MSLCRWTSIEKTKIDAVPQLTLPLNRSAGYKTLFGQLWITSQRTSQKINKQDSKKRWSSRRVELFQPISTTLACC
ncbi:hypothetical protein AV530_013288 [Patagioenas fasciata monilis]|uniref:Uncharacterized protein n=1 Tax=Patagioenas fasciata monilis TaxID=372326 RepID=A0A1V4JNT3_PATFA|nr:hypothetical protein AV530_013288 [Patagioenas fasciata monilis]